MFPGIISERAQTRSILFALTVLWLYLSSSVESVLGRCPNLASFCCCTDAELQHLYPPQAHYRPLGSSTGPSLANASAYLDAVAPLKSPLAVGHPYPGLTTTSHSGPPLALSQRHRPPAPAALLHHPSGIPTSVITAATAHGTEDIGYFVEDLSFQPPTKKKGAC